MQAARAYSEEIVMGISTSHRFKRSPAGDVYPLVEDPENPGTYELPLHWTLCSDAEAAEYFLSVGADLAALGLQGALKPERRSRKVTEAAPDPNAEFPL
jgi:hypothetical protein